jgi:hypothetical protein
VSLTLSAKLESTVFWPSTDHNVAAPYWPHLKTLDVTFDMVSPNGDWYFIGPLVNHKEDDPERSIIGDCDSDCDSDCDPDTNYTYYRDDANPNTFDPFLVAFAKAVQNMPVLEHFMLTSELGHGKGKLHNSYNAPGRVADWGDEDATDLMSRRVYYACQVGKAGFWEACIWKIGGPRAHGNNRMPQGMPLRHQ